MRFYTGENILPKVTLTMRSAEAPAGKIEDQIDDLQLKSMPQISFSVKWEPGGGAALADKLIDFSNPTAVKFLRGAKYKTPASNGKWTARTVKGAEHLVISLDFRILSSGNYKTFTGNPPAGAVNSETVDKTMNTLMSFFYFERFKLEHAIREAKELLDNGVNGDYDLIESSKNLLSHTKDAAIAAAKMGYDTFKSEDSTQRRKTNLDNDKEEFRSAMGTLGKDVDTFIAKSSGGGKVTGGLPLINVIIVHEGIPYKLYDIDFYAQSINIKPSTQLMDGRSLYYDISLGLISREIVTKEMLYG